jgi:Tfp pilus assembly protein PilF
MRLKAVYAALLCGAMAVPASSAQHEEFNRQLFRGGELLAAGKLNEAKESLEKAHSIQPKDSKSRNLLGLTYFKLGMYARAGEVYETLVRDNPTDHTLHVNLGLVYLKSNVLDKAIHEFEIATDLAPEYQKAQNYLGLALEGAGRTADAQKQFAKAANYYFSNEGSAMVRKEALAKVKATS